MSIYVLLEEKPNSNEHEQEQRMKAEIIYATSWYIIKGSKLLAKITLNRRTKESGICGK